MEAAAPHVDRLSAFLDAFELRVRVSGSVAAAGHLFVLETDATGSRRLVLCTQSTVRPTGAGAILVSAEVDFGGDANPLLRSLPCELALTTAAGDPLWALTENFIGEAFQARCGGKAALARLGELLVLMLLRSAIDQGSTQPGVLAGLAHPRLRVAVAAMLKQPGKDWTMDALADCCSMSRSQFMADFRRFLGFTPGAFLSGWRMTLARRDLGRGERVKAVAARSGYTSAAAFSRAYSRAFGEAPGASRPGSSVEVASPARRGQSGNC